MKVIPTFTQEEIDAIDLLERAILDGTKYANTKWLSFCKTKNGILLGADEIYKET